MEEIEETSNLSNTTNLEKEMQKNYSYPDPDDEDIQYKLYKKREFYYHKIPERPDLTSYADIKEYRDNICMRRFALHDHQELVSNFINPDTPYKGIILFHGLGSGKTCAGIAIGEKFKPMVQKYGTKIYILVNGPLLKASWREQLLKCTGETYIKYQDKTTFMSAEDKMQQEKNALGQVKQFYEFMSYRSFYKRVLGEKIIDRKQSGDEKVKVTYRKTEEGDYERDIAINRIYNMNNSLLIVDEAHNLTGNAYGEALKLIIKNSVNLRVVLLTATPMKNLADDIIELINFIRPLNAPMEREKIFTGDKNYELDLKNGGLEYFKKMASGYISHVRGADPLTYAKRIDKGEVPNGLLFTKVIRCKMMPFQQHVYDHSIRESDALDRKSEAVANFAFPGLSQDRKNLVGYYGREGIDIIRNQIRSNYDLLNKRIAEEILETKDIGDFITVTEDGKKVTGEILNIKYLRNFSAKFYSALKKINRLVWGKKGPQTAFIYSNLVRVGIDLFEQVLLQNGYLAFQEEGNYQIKPDTVCYYCGKPFSEHHDKHHPKKGGSDEELTSLVDSDEEETEEIEEMEEMEEKEETDEDEEEENTLLALKEKEAIKEEEKEAPVKQSNAVFIKNKDKDNKENREENKKSSSEYVKYTKHSEHDFKPATFITLTGKSSEDTVENIPEEQQKILKNVFNSIENKDGKFIKLVLGSKVMNEGINLFHVGEVHILDVWFNFGRVDQVVGRAIRYCSHYKLMTEENMYPKVNVYKYVVHTPDGLSTDEDLYRKAESKYLLIKKIERAMKEIAIDCPLNVHGNMFNEEIEEFKNCGDKKNPCPVQCDYTNCEYKCNNIKLNVDYYDPKRKLYKKIGKNGLDYSTFTNSLARNEIDFAKKKIKEMYLKKYSYTIEQIIDTVKDAYDEEKRDLFDEFFVYKALDELIPLTENEFNNFKDTIIDKFNQQGYIIYVNKYYIFQPFSQNENVSMYYRTNFDATPRQKLSLINYLKNNDKYLEFKEKNRDELSEKILRDEYSFYDFDSVMEYYESRDEFMFVGIIDKELSRKKSKNLEDIQDVFKIREKRAKILDKKRGTGIPSIKGAVCATSKNKEYLEKIAKKLGTTVGDSRIATCENIKEKMLELEKYSTGKDKMTYVMVPANHKEYPFPYNLEDRAEYIANQVKNIIEHKLDIKIEKHFTKDKKQYIIIFKESSSIAAHKKEIEKIGFRKNKDNKDYYTMIIQ